MIFRHSRSKEPIFYTYEVCTKKADTITHIFRLQAIEIYIKKLYYTGKNNVSVGNFLLHCDCFNVDEHDEEAIENTIELLRSLTRKEIDKITFELSKNYKKDIVKEYKEFYYKQLEFDPKEDAIYRPKDDGSIECIGIKQHKYQLYQE
jgi:hypothetical protein